MPRAYSAADLERITDTVRAARAIAACGLARTSSKLMLGSLRSTAAAVGGLKAIEDERAKTLALIGGLASVATQKSRLEAIRYWYVGRGLEVPQEYAAAYAATNRVLSARRRGRWA
jgi:hypothetical protein